MTWGLSFFAVGLAMVGLISFWRRPKPFAALSFLAFALIILGLLSLGMTGAWVERLFRPLIYGLGLGPDSSESFWRIGLMLSVACPPGLLIAHFASLRAIGYLHIVLFVVSFIVYCFLCNLVVHGLIRAM
jgi:hypothetical protein